MVSLLGTETPPLFVDSRPDRRNFNLQRVRLLRDLNAAGAFYTDGNYELRSGAKSTFYANIRTSSDYTVIGNKRRYGVLDDLLLKTTAGLLYSLLQQSCMPFGVIAPVPNAANALAASIADMHYDDTGVRPPIIHFQKTGRQISGIVGDEFVTRSDKLIIVENVTTTGKSVAELIEVYMGRTLCQTPPTGVFTVLDRESGARELLRTYGVTLYALFTLSEIPAILNTRVGV